ncbi:hypothetical protein RWE15_24375 [Virgibacillus halophilus]|uniref:Spore coat protein D n=1 Tax=Tigheibacillus halophilus TaxID=361280 RepID=A0ABU5CCC6_9BACI|nr:hypothetical protein [Virgibacillus halophilus]
MKKKKEKIVKPPKHEHKHEYMPMPHPQQMMPMCCYVMYPCCPPHQMPWHQPMPFPQPAMAHPFQGFGHEHMMEMPVKPSGHMMDDCGCGPASGHMHVFREGNAGQDDAASNMNYYPPANMQFGGRKLSWTSRIQIFYRGKYRIK